MRESGNYPAGAEYDPRAPWNQVDPETEECEECHGTGKIYTAYDINLNVEVQCTETTYNLLPDDEDEARAKGQHFIKGEEEICSCCNGTGYVEVPEYEPDYDEDRYDEWRERDII